MSLGWLLSLRGQTGFRHGTAERRFEVMKVRNETDDFYFLYLVDRE